MTGAAIDPDVITETARQMAPTLMQHMALDDLDAAYTRWLAVAMRDPEQRSVLVTAHNLLSSWNTLQSEVAAARAADLEQKALAYRAEVQAGLSGKKRKVTNIADLARRDGVALPFAPGRAEKPQEARESYDAMYPPKEYTEADRMEQAAREQRNREVWHKLAAEHESLVDKP